MYLSQPCDLGTSSSAGCSRNTTHETQSDHLAQLPMARTDRYPSRYETESSCTSASSSSGYQPNRMQNLLASKTDDSSGQWDRAHKPVAHVEPDSLSAAMSNLEGRTQSRWFRSRHFQKVWEELDAGNSETRPPHPYTELIKLCILKRREGKLTLNQLYRDLEHKFPFFATSERGKGWKNTLRHNLSTQPYFIKLEREHGQLGKGHYWAYCPDLEKPTSLAQSSVVQLSSLWPPSVSAASVPPREDSARQHCSATEFQHLPHTFRPKTTAQSLPWYDVHDTRRELQELPPCNYQGLQAGAERTALLASSLRGPPVFACDHPFPTADSAKSRGLARMRSATISSPPKLKTETIQTTSPEWNRRRSSSFRPAPSSSSISPTAEGSRKTSTESVSRPALPDLPRLPARKSLGDYYLSHPISSTRKTPVSCPTALPPTPPWPNARPRSPS